MKPIRSNSRAAWLLVGTFSLAGIAATGCESSHPPHPPSPVAQAVTDQRAITLLKQMSATLAEAVAVGLTKGGAPSAGDTQAVMLAPKGSKPGMIIANTAQVTGKIESIDAQKRTVTIAEAEGKPVTMKVGPKVDLGDVKAGDDVTAQCTQAMSILVEKP